MGYLTTQSKSENIETAKRLLIDLGIKNFDFSGYSDTNGVSVYFKDENYNKIRVSSHSVSNTSRIQGESHFKFDSRTMSGSISCKFKENTLMAKHYGY